jgi:signal transduction histidine kinase
MRSLAAGVALSLVAVLLASWNAWAAYRSLALVARSDIQLTRQGGEIMRLDELLTMSARLGAATGDPKWEERYRRWEPVLDQQIKASIALDGEFGVESSSATDAANRRLVEMENQAFALVRAGERDAAFRLLASPEYESQKLIYAQGNEATLTSARDRIDKRLALHSRRARASVVFTLALGLLLAIAWLRIIHMVQHHLDARATAEDEALSAKREAQEATRAKSAFLANMSHELRTPMNGVLGCTELLAATGLNEEQRLYVATVRDSSQTLLSLLDDILDISKIEAGKLAFGVDPGGPPDLDRRDHFPGRSASSGQARRGGRPRVSGGPGVAHGRSGAAAPDRPQLGQQRGQVHEPRARCGRRGTRGTPRGLGVARTFRA